MKNLLKALLAIVLGVGLAISQAGAQTDGTATLETTILDYPGDSSAEHWTVVWVTTEAGAFIKSLRKQGPGWTQNHWGSHCRIWNDARGGSASGSQALDGYSSATATTYSGTNSPLIIRWNGRDANNNLMPDGNYKFWVQYAEDDGQGPHTTNGMLWVKGPAGVTNTFANVAGYFSNRKIRWVPSITAVAPTITSAVPMGTATVGVPYSFTCTASGTPPIAFTASGLPTGLAMSATGVISGTPTAAGTFSGTITAANGTAPNALQAFSINVSVVPAGISGIELQGKNLILSGTGPANGGYTVMSSTDATSVGAAWTPSGSGTFSASGLYRYTNAINAGEVQRFYKLRIP